jgi:hypothetical protein
MGAVSVAARQKRISTGGATVLSEAKDVAAWKSILRQWIKKFPSGTIFRSKDVFSWVADGGVDLNPGDLKPINNAGREIWRHRVSRALKQLHGTRELSHPGISSHAWRIP